MTQKTRRAKDAEVRKEMMIGQVISEHPEAIDVMLEHGMQCIGCHVATWESLEQGAQSHGIDVDMMVREINATISLAGKKS